MPVILIVELIIPLTNWTEFKLLLPNGGPNAARVYLSLVFFLAQIVVEPVSTATILIHFFTLLSFVSPPVVYMTAKP